MVSDPNVLALIETTAGEPLSMRDVTETATQLMSLGRFEDVQAAIDPLPGGVRVRFLLVPLHPVDRVEFLGPLGVPENDLRALVRDRFGRTPSAARQAEIADVIRAHYWRRGFPVARVTPRIVETHNPDRATLILDLDSGPRAVVETVQLIQVDQQEQGVLPVVPDVRQGRPYDEDDITAAIDDWIAAMHARGFYEARASFGVAFPGSAAHVQLTLTRGPAVTIAFAGDPLSASERDRLVPVRAEGSADQDLLEDSSRAIEDYLYDLGYRDARAAYAPVEQGGELTITFTIRRGPRYRLDSVTVTGASAIPVAEVREALQLKEDAPFVQAALTAGIARVQALYRSRGYIRADITPGTSVLPAGADAADRQIEATIAIIEGPRTLVRSVTFQGNTTVAEASLNAVIASAPGKVFSEGEVASDREVINFEYRNRGFESVVVSAQTTLSGGDTDANIVFTVSEGPQTFVDDLIIIGNDRTSRATIEREMLLRTGEPLGYSALLESRSRIMALGLFSSVQIEPQGQPSAARRDVLVRVEESNPNTIGGGGGLEGTVLLRPTGEEGNAEERLDIAPHGFIELGRRNLWGKNRAVTLFTRLSFRSRDRRDSEGVVTSSQGFHEYRVQTTFREPRIFDSAADALFTASSEQALRSSFNFSRRLVRGEASLRLSPVYSVLGRYSFEQTQLFDDDGVPVNDRPLIDRLFSEVRLSKLAGSLIRDTRDDLVNATRGRLFILDGNLAARVMGSEVGFVSTYVQGFTFHKLPGRREIIAAIGGRLGVAHGFPRTVGDQIVQDLPASERFFAGGETTVRGFALDRLGNAATTTPTGFPTGGNSVVVLNAELRAGVTSRLQAVGFLDAGNVFPRAGDLSLTDLRVTPGVGGRFNAGLALIRVDVGFNVDRREILPGIRERGYVLHISLGQAF
jgi:outer membrane protein insertion porin family